MAFGAKSWCPPFWFDVVFFPLFSQLIKSKNTKLLSSPLYISVIIIFLLFIIIIFRCFISFCFVFVFFYPIVANLAGGPRAECDLRLGNSFVTPWCPLATTEIRFVGKKTRSTGNPNEFANINRPVYTTAHVMASAPNLFIRMLYHVGWKTHVYICKLLTFFYFFFSPFKTKPLKYPKSYENVRKPYLPHPPPHLEGRKLLTPVLW